MNTEIFFKKIRTYYNISKEAELAWTNLLQFKKYDKNDNFVTIGQNPRKIGFVVNGLFSQNYILEDGSVVIKYFFPEHRLAASLVAMLTNNPSDFYIAYNELHWIIEKEPLEIAFRTETSAKRYDDFLKKYPNLVKRLKKQHISSYLGITPTQLSRIFLINK
jgi:hypothetical protein